MKAFLRRFVNELGLRGDRKSPEAAKSDFASPNRLEIAHVLFIDIVAYSQMPMDEQEKTLSRLQSVVRGTPDFSRARASGEVTSLPTGDGMALVFWGDAEAPIRCALALNKELRTEPVLPVRMGIHSGPVYRFADINANLNVAGGGINLAQRVMDCGDAGHILMSDAVAGILKQLTRWRDAVHDLGEVQVKHGVRLHLFNLFESEFGNPSRPEKLCFQRVLLPGAIVAGEYRLLEGMFEVRTICATTVRAQSLQTNDICALWIFDRMVHPLVFAEFEAEIEKLRELDHPNISRVYEIGEIEDGRKFLRTELLQGESLGNWLRREGPLTTTQAVALASQLIDALAIAHRAGLFHRDLSTYDILLQRGRDNLHTIKLYNFGMAVLRGLAFEKAKEGLTKRGIVMGTPTFMAPEMLLHFAGERDLPPVDKRVDIYAAGAVLYRMVTGEEPFGGHGGVLEAFALMTKDAIPAHQRRPDLNIRQSLSNVIAKAMARRPEDRFQSAEEFAAALQEAVPIVR